MQGDGQNVRIFIEDLLDSIAVVAIDVNIQNPIEPLSQDADSKSRIIENANPEAREGNA